MTAINTYTGKKVDLLNPQPSDIQLVDIAHGLAHIGRFVGQGSDFYSVGQHSLNVCLQLERQGESSEVQLYGLLHDASEAYIGDVPGTLKPELECFQGIEDEFMNVIWNWSGLGSPTESEYKTVAHCDKLVFEHEADEFLPSYESNPKENIELDLYGSTNFERVTDRYIDYAENRFDMIVR